MITRDVARFLEAARGCAADFGPATAKSAFLVAPDGFARAEQSAGDNRYMASARDFDPALAAAQHRGLQRALSRALPTLCFPGDPEAPDGVFPNNVFATIPGRLVVGRMRHAVRQREALRGDIRGFFRDTLGYLETDLSTQPHPCELTGALVVDRARGLGFCGLSERCDEAGARLMHEAFGLRASLMFDLAAGEYHTNVVLAVLAGRALVVSPAGLADPAVADAIASLYAPHAVMLSADEQAAFAGNAIAVSGNGVWMSGRAADGLSGPHRALLEQAGFRIHDVPLDALEAAGGSLRCCVAEIF